MRVWEPKVVGQGEGGFGSPRLAGRDKEGRGEKKREGEKKKKTRRRRTEHPSANKQLYIPTPDRPPQRLLR
jgi:hypothetical protein